MDSKGDSSEDSTPSAAGAAPGPSSASKRKKAYNMEPRTPLKRQRLPVQRFQSPAEEQPQQAKPSKSPKEDVELVHKKGIFLAVRGDEGSFYLCRTQQNVFTNTRHFKIQWLDLVEPPDVYKFDFLDHTEIECVLMNIKMERVTRETYRLPDTEKVKIENVLTKALKKEKGELIDEDLSMETTEEDLQVDDEEWEDEPSPKKAKVTKEKKSKVTPKSRKSITVALKAGKVAKTSGKKTTRTKALEKQKAEKGKRTAQSKAAKKPEKEKKKGPDRKLKPNPKIKVLEKDPLFHTKDHVPFISKQAHEKLVFRAVLLNDMTLLKQLKDDDQHIYSLCESRSVADTKTTIHYAMKKNNIDAVALLTKDFFEDSKTNKRKVKKRPPLLINTMDTGSYNPRFLGIRNVRKLTVSRGGKEGNDAFTKEHENYEYTIGDDVLDDAITNGVNKETIDNFIASCSEDYQDGLRNGKFEKIHFAVIRGHRELAGKLIEESGTGHGFNFLHKDVLLFTDEDLKSFQSASVRKKPHANSQITPLHCACINPNKKYLEKLLSVEPDINLDDKVGRRPIHFAAACEGTGPLECLLSKGASPYEVTRRKFTPLHYACYAGRAQNADLLLKKAKAAGSGDAASMLISKWGVGGVNRPNWESICPVHIAAQRGDIELLKVLIKNGADLNKPLSAGKEKLSPLMIAAGHGYLDIVRLLVQNNAVVEQLDKFKRSALTHAVVNGCTTVASYLLYLGADPNRVDSSGNSLVHYAAAYGWYFVLKLLVNEGNADPRVANDWKVTPVGIAFMKGHMGLVDFLLKMPGVDINFKNDTGKTLLSIACSSQLQAGLYEQVIYLMDRGADPKIQDIDGMQALHHLAANTVKANHYDPEDSYEKRMDTTLKIAELLLEGGCDPSVKTRDGHTAITLAVEKLNTKLVKFLVEKGGAVTAEKTEKGKNVLHLLAEQCIENELAPLLQILATEKKKSDIKENGLDESMEVDNDKTVKSPDNNVTQLKKEMSKSGQDILKHMATEVDNEGYTPLLCACRKYMMFKKPNNVTDQQFQKMLQNGRDFIKRLIDITEVNVSQTVQKKYFKDKPPTDKSKLYTENGKCSAVHFMVHSGAKKHDSSCLGLKLILNCKPDLELRDLNEMTALALAVDKKCLTAVQMLVEAGANPNISYPIDKDHEGTVLNTAAKNGNTEIVKLLLQGGAKVDLRNSKTKQTALHIAVQTRDNETSLLEITTALLNAGIDINAVDADKRTAMHLAVNYNTGTSNASTDVEELLISRGANLLLKDSLDRNPLHYAFAKVGRWDDSSALDPIELCSLLTKAMDGTDIDGPDYLGKSPLHLAAFRGATICCIHLIQRSANISRKDHQGNTPLSFAVDKKHDSCAMMLIQKGANVRDLIVKTKSAPPIKEAQVKQDEKPDWDWKPERDERDEKKRKENEKKEHTIFQVLQNPALMLMQALIFRVNGVSSLHLHKSEIYLETGKTGAILNELQGVAHMVLDSTEIDSSAVEAALKVSQYNVVLRLLKKIKDNGRLSVTNEKRQNLLHILGLHTSPGSNSDLQMKVARVLLDRGLSLSLTDENGCTPLHYAALRHQPFELGKLFIENDSQLDLSKKDKFDRTVLAAFFWNHVCLVESTDESNKWLTLLLSKGANLDILYDFPLSEVPEFDVFMTEVPDYFTTASAYRISPLIFSINYFKFGLSKFLLQHNASPNFKDSSGLTPLMHAVKKNDLHAVKVLLNHSHDTEGEVKLDGKPTLTKKLSRQVFAINLITSVVEEDDNDDQDDEEDNNDEEDAEDDDDDEQEADEEEEEVNEDEDQDEADEEADEDSDHDTDVVDDDEDDDDGRDDEVPEKFPTLSRLGSKQPSLLRQGSSLNKDEFPVVEKTSSVNLSDIDTQGWTVIHHLVSPLEYGTFDNEEILYVLARCGANTQMKDKAGLSPLDHALIRGATKLAQRLQKLAGVENGKMEKPTFASVEVKDNVLGSFSADYKADAQEMLKQIKEKQMDVDENKSESLADVDDKCNIKDVGEVVKDASQGIPYDVLLSKVDVSCGPWGMYNFYKMQIVYHKAMDMYVLFTRWGRIGDVGQFQHTPFQKKAEAITEFGKIFRSKTGNYWSNVGSFENHPKKYRLIARENKPRKAHKIDFSLQSEIPSKLPQYVQDLMKEMTRVNMLTAAVNKAGLDSNFMPFGLIKREALIEAKKILIQLGEVIKTVEDLRKRVMTADDTALYQTNCEKISKLTNDYYHLLPCEDYAHWKIKPISNLNMLRDHSRLLADLLDLECASKILLGAQAKLSQINPLDYIYQSIGCKMELLNEESAEAQYILKYIFASGRKSKVKAIFRISRSKEEETMRSLGIDNHKLLWHGSSVSNFISILHRGLLLCPPEVPITGNLFGDGIYFADTFEKSAMYCHNYDSDSKTKLMVLCEVALGKCQANDPSRAFGASTDFTDLTDTDFNSKKIVAAKQPDQDFDVALPYGATIPLGQIRSTPQPENTGRFQYRLPHNEFIVQNPSQVCLRYLVQFV